MLIILINADDNLNHEQNAFNWKFNWTFNLVKNQELFGKMLVFLYQKLI